MTSLVSDGMQGERIKAAIGDMCPEFGTNAGQITSVLRRQAPARPPVRERMNSAFVQP